MRTFGLFIWTAEWYGKLILLILTWLEVKKIQSIKVSTKSSTDNLERKKIHSNEKLLHLHWIEFNSYFTLFDDTNMQPYDIWWQRINVQREIDRFVIWVSQMVELLNIDRFNAWCYQFFLTIIFHSCCSFAHSCLYTYFQVPVVRSNMQTLVKLSHNNSYKRIGTFEIFATNEKKKFKQVWWLIEPLLQRIV